MRLGQGNAKLGRADEVARHQGAVPEQSPVALGAPRARS